MKIVIITSINGKETVTMNAENQLTNTATLFALALASDLNNSDVIIQGIAPGPIEKNTMYKTENTTVK